MQVLCQCLDGLERFREHRDYVRTEIQLIFFMNNLIICCEKYTHKLYVFFIISDKLFALTNTPKHLEILTTS